MNIQIPFLIQTVVQGVHDVLGSDAEVVLVGGSVRDILLGNTPKDYDFATALLPDEVERRVRAAGKRAYTIGKRFGTIGFKLEGQYIEVTTYRQELYDKNSRKPSVTFTNILEEDLARRDFTMNAIALNMQGEVTDPFNGKADIQTGVIRAVGNADERFEEDPLRILRMARFVARYGFKVETQTYGAAQTLAYKLTTISPERVSAEMDGILVAPKVTEGLRCLHETGLVSFIVPFLAMQDDKQWLETSEYVAQAEANIEQRWAALLRGVGAPFTATHSMAVGAMLVNMLAHHLHWSNERRQRVQELITTRR